MPTVGIPRDLLFEALGRSYTEDEFQEMCFEFGIELDEVTMEKPLNTTKRGVTDAEGDEVATFKIEVPANRYDLLCLEGLATALNAFNGREPPPTFTLAPPPASGPLLVTVSPETSEIRPYVVCAILRDVALTPAAYTSLIELQDRLHHNICRRRSLVAIGTHDLDTLSPPFTYEARPPSDIVFRPLGEDAEFDADALLRHYAKDSKMSKFTPLIAGAKRFPCLYDSKRTLLSLPPIINGWHSRMSPSIRNVFIECTAVDLTKANITLNTIVAMFSRYCKVPFSVEPVTVQYPPGPSHPKLAGRAIQYPDLSPGLIHADVGYIQRAIGLPPSELPPARICELLGRMMLPATAVPPPAVAPAHGGAGAQGVVAVTVPVTRSDILHACDVMEDVAIAYSMNKIPAVVPFVASHGSQQPLNQLQELVRNELAAAGYTEALVFALSSAAEAFGAMRLQDDGKTAVVVGNPKTSDFEVCRISLLPGLLKTAASNRKLPLPWRYFEVSDVVLLDPAADVGAKNERRLSAVCCVPGTSGFEQIHGLVDRVMTTFGLSRQAGTLRADEDMPAVAGGTYSLAPSEHVSFMAGRQARVFANRLSAAGEPLGVRSLGYFGVVHPEVLSAFDLPFPGSALELDLEALV